MSAEDHAPAIDPRDHYVALIESSDDGIVTKDLDGNVISWNPAAERLFGWTAKEMAGQSIRRLLPPDRQQEEDRILARIRAGEKVPQFLTERLHKDGHLIHVAVSISPVRNTQGEIVGASKIVRDASERVEAERQLRESEERFRLLAENMSQFAWMADADGKISWYNQRWTEYTGMRIEDMVQGARYAVVHPDHVERVYENYRRAIDAGADYEDTFPIRGKDGSYRWFLSRAQPIRKGDGAITRWFGTNTDITDQREQAEQINLLLREVNHRSKNMLAKVQALARNSMGGDEVLVKRFEERVGSLAVNQDILIRRDWREVPLDELVRLQLAFLGDVAERVTSGGAHCALTPRAAEVVGMSLHELATNSLKYGALSEAQGRVAIEWACPPDAFHIAWRESSGPRVQPPRRRGFGTSLIDDIPRRTLDAEVRLAYEPGGLVWELDAGGQVLADRARLVS